MVAGWMLSYRHHEHQYLYAMDEAIRRACASELELKQLSHVAINIGSIKG
jgi:hypothetical protein